MIENTVYIVYIGKAQVVSSTKTIHFNFVNFSYILIGESVTEPLIAGFYTV
jgi:hypothetical protein